MMVFDPEKFLNRTFYAFSFEAMLGDVQSFLEFSENNIEWQFRRELQSIGERAKVENLPRGYYEHLVENAEHRFKVALPMRVRYAALIALITTVEWEAKFLKERAIFAIEKPGKTNDALHTLRAYNTETRLQQDSILENYQRIIVIRNAIVHSAGIESNYKHRDDLHEAVNGLQGFSISDWHFFGECVTIEQGALTTYIEQMANLIPQLGEKADENGLLQETR